MKKYLNLIILIKEIMERKITTRLWCMIITPPFLIRDFGIEYWQVISSMVT